MMTKKLKRRGSLRLDYTLYIMLVPALVLTAIFRYGPLLGWQVAFKKYNIALGMMNSPWSGLDNFEYLFRQPGIGSVIFNTVYISTLKIIINFILPIVVAILLNEVIFNRFKRVVQTLIYLPYFISWVVLGGVFISILSPTDGAVNQILGTFGIQPVNFLGDNSVFPYTLVATDAWKGFGYGTIIYMAALTSIDPGLYEAAAIDGAGRFRRMWHITIPGIVPIMVLVGTLNMGNLLKAGFDQVFNLYNASVYRSGDILDTFTYRLGMIQAQYDVATAVGLIQSVVSLVLVSVSYFMAYKFADYRIF